MGSFAKDSTHQPFEIEADMAISYRLPGKGGKDKDLGSSGGGKALEGSDKIAVELVQHSAGNELFNLPDHAPSPARLSNIAESCSMRAKGGRSANTPKSEPESGCIPLKKR